MELKNSGGVASGIRSRQIIGRAGRIQGDSETAAPIVIVPELAAVAVMEADWLDVTPVPLQLAAAGIPNKKVELVVAEPAILHLRAIVLTVPLGIVKLLSSVKVGVAVGAVTVFPPVFKAVEPSYSVQPVI